MTIQASNFVDAAAARGFGFFTGVPCSYLTALTNYVLNRPDLRHVGATNEGEAIAIAAGGWLAGQRAVVMVQNSGLGNMVNPLTSLNHTFRIPALLVCTWRGQPGRADEPQHALMGTVTPQLLDTLRVGWRLFPGEPDQVAPALAAADAAMSADSLPYALLMPGGAVRAGPPAAPPTDGFEPGLYRDHRVGNARRPGRMAALAAVLDSVPGDAAVVASTGMCGRELYALGDRAAHLYVVGSLGLASAIGLGVALHSRRTVVVLDGDGAALMHLGNFATIGATAPPNLVHIVLDNGVHDSTGGQPSASATTRFADVALACGYRGGVDCDTVDGLRAALVEAVGAAGPHLVHARIRPGSTPGVGRPDVQPPDVARRFREFLCGRAAPSVAVPTGKE